MQVIWLMTCKQTSLEGLAEFHQRSVWLFRTSSEFARTDYVFPIIKTTLASEHHLLVLDPGEMWKSRYHRPGLPFSLHHNDEGEGSAKVTWNVLTPCNRTMELVNVTTTSAESYDEVRTIKPQINIHQSAFPRIRYRPKYSFREDTQTYLDNVVWVLAKLERLAIHRKLRTFQVQVHMRQLFSIVWTAKLSTRLSRTW
jgi:hypothetical protein